MLFNILCTIGDKVMRKIDVKLSVALIINKFDKVTPVYIEIVSLPISNIYEI